MRRSSRLRLGLSVVALRGCSGCGAVLRPGEDGLGLFALEPPGVNLPARDTGAQKPIESFGAALPSDLPGCKLVSD